MKPSKQKVKADLNLDQLPDDEFMELLEYAQKHPTPKAPRRHGASSKFTPTQIRALLASEAIALSVGQVMAEARRESGKSLAEVGEEMGVSRGRVGHLEQQENIEVATLVSLADALGYDVLLTLVPREAKRKALSTKLLAVG